MPSTITTSIVVQFTKGGTDGLFKVEVDGREAAIGGLNGGRTSFLPGDPVRLLLYKSSTVTVDHVEASIGLLSASAVTVSVLQEEDVTFAGETEATLGYPTTGPLSVTWIGRNLGTLSLIGDSTVRVPEPAAGDYAVGVARVKYTSLAYVYTLTHSDPGLTEYPIVAYFLGSSL